MGRMMEGKINGVGVLGWLCGRVVGRSSIEAAVVAERSAAAAVVGRSTNAAALTEQAALAAGSLACSASVNLEVGMCRYF